VGGAHPTLTADANLSKLDLAAIGKV